MSVSAAATFNVAAAAAAAVQLIHNPNTGEHICPLCMKTFYGAQSRKTGQRHIQTAHSNTKYRCEICEKLLPRKDKFKEHVTKVHTISSLTAAAMLQNAAVSC